MSKGIDENSTEVNQKNGPEGASTFRRQEKKMVPIRKIEKETKDL